MENQLLLNKKPKTWPVIVIVIVVAVVVGVVIPLCFSKIPNDLTAEEATYSNYAIEQAKIDPFENPLISLLTLKVIVTKLEKVSDNTTCTIYDYDNNGKGNALNNSYFALVKAKTFFGITIASANIFCNGASTVLF